MSQKKKLILGPLPEELDLSQYEETVTRWDRVIGVLLVGFILVSVLVYIFLPKAEQPNEPANSSAAVPSPVLPEPGAPAETPLAMPEEPEVTVAETVDMSEKEPAETEDVIEASPVLAESTLPAQPAPVSSDASSVDSQSTPAISSEVLATVSIKHPALSRVVLTRELKNKEPGSALPAELVLPESGITKIILFTEMRGLRGQTLFHDWYRNGVRQARVKIPVNVQTQRSFSSKFINTQMTGDWQVKVVDANAILYAEAGFSILAP